MYAVVNIQGSQFKVEKGQKLYVNRLSEEAGKAIEFGEVLLVDDNGKVTVGKPFVEGVKVKAKVLDHLKDDKVIVFKKKRRKGYRVKNGHRQLLSQIEIESITGKSSKAKKQTKAKSETEEKPQAKAKPKKKTEAKAETKKKSETKAKPKKETKKQKEAPAKGE